MKLPVFIPAIILTGAAICIAAPVRFIPATPTNTTSVDGSPLPQSGVWKWLPQEGNQGVFESAGDPVKNAPPLIIGAKGLEPGRDYEVFGFFWAHGFGDAPAARGKQPHHWPARFGLGLATLTTFGGKFSPDIPWIISPDSPTGGTEGWIAVLEEKNRLVQGVPDWILSKEDLRLVRARLGISRADKEGTLPVFVDDFPDSKYCGLTRIDGIGVGIAPAGAAATAGAGDPGALHHALRAGDKLSVARELEAGANANTLDASGLSTLFHPASTGDMDMVRLLLSKGADPNVQGQSVLALTAAASTGDVAMLRLLLDGGAEVPGGMLELPPWSKGTSARYGSWEPTEASQMHPAIAAIRIGSLGALKALLEKKPDLDLEALGPKEGVITWILTEATSLRLIEEAMVMGHDELAAFLIDRGCTLRSKILDRFSKNPDLVLLARSITEGKALEKSREALLRRKVSVINSNRKYGYELKPWDGLSAAICVGNVALTERLISAASRTTLTDRQMLFALARWSGNAEILRILVRAFPEAALGWELRPPESGEEQDAAPLRLLVPRIKPAPTTKRDDGNEWTIAVVPAPDEGGQSALLEVAASNAGGWKVVDRQEIKAALGEARFANPWGNGEHRLADLGDRISADLLILVSRLEGKDLQLLRFEAIDVATGLPVLREHMESKAFASEAAAGPMLARIRAAFAKARAGDRPKAITMLPFSVGEHVPNAAALARLFTAAIHAEVDATPGLLAVGKDQIQAIADEQKLAGKEGLWAAAFTLEGGVNAEPDGKVSLTLRLRPLDGGTDSGMDVTESGSAAGIATLATRAWGKLASTDPLAGETSSPAKPDRRQAAEEAARLLREGEWLVNSGSPSEALPLFERAELLGADPGQLVAGHLGAMAKCINIIPKGINLYSLGKWVRDHPFSPAYQLKICGELPDSQAMLDQAAYYLARYGADTFKWKHPRRRNSERSELMRTLILLSSLRAALPKELPAGMSVEDVQKFGESLDRFTADYFRLRSAMKDPTMSPAPTMLKLRGPGTAAMLRRNPELLKGWVTMFFACSYSEMSAAFRTPLLGELVGDGITEISGISGPYGRTNLILDEILLRMDEYKGQNRPFRESEIAFLRATGDARATAGKHHAAEVAKLGRSERFKQQDWIGGNVLQRYGSKTLLFCGHKLMPHNEDEMLAALVHEPLGNMDQIAHPKYGPSMIEIVALEENPGQNSSIYGKSHTCHTFAWDYLDKLAEEISKDAEAWQSIERLRGGGRLWELIYGRPLHDALRERWKGLYEPKERAADTHALTARLLTDLRSVDHFNPGMFRLPTIDNAHPERLWLFFQPFEAKPTPRDGDSTSRQPWLLGINGVDGKISTAVNLARAPGFNSNVSNLNSFGFEGDEGFIVQTKDLILTTAYWAGVKGETDGAQENAVLFHKEDGRFQALDPATSIGAAPDVLRKSLGSAGAVAFGDEFLCLQKAGDPDAFYMDNEKTPFQLIRISTAGKVSPVTMFGRRPQLTPFDPVDRFPRMILRDGGRLLVIRDPSHIAHFNPADNSWEMDDQDNAKRMETAFELTTNDYRSHIFPRSTIQVGNGKPDLIVSFTTSLPDMLVLESESHGEGETRIKVRLELPDGFSTQPIFSDLLFSNGQSGNVVGYATYDNRKGKEDYGLVVLNQTKDDLILGMQVGLHRRWLPGKRIGAFLPLVWAVPKSELISAYSAKKASSEIHR